MVLGRDMSIKQILGKVMAISNPSESKNDLLHKIFLAEENHTKLEKITSKTRGKSKGDLLQMKIKKIVRIDRNPPSPYSIERVKISKIIFKVLRKCVLRGHGTRQAQVSPETL